MKARDQLKRIEIHPGWIVMLKSQKVSETRIWIVEGGSCDMAGGGVCSGWNCTHLGLNLDL